MRTGVGSSDARQEEDETYVKLDGCFPSAYSFLFML
jgi:hypothetical protein